MSCYGLSFYVYIYLLTTLHLISYEKGFNNSCLLDPFPQTLCMFHIKWKFNVLVFLFGNTDKSNSLPFQSVTLLPAYSKLFGWVTDKRREGKATYLFSRNSNLPVWRVVMVVTVCLYGSCMHDELPTSSRPLSDQFTDSPESAVTCEIVWIVSAVNLWCSKPSDFVNCSQPAAYITEHCER